MDERVGRIDGGEPAVSLRDRQSPSKARTKRRVIPTLIGLLLVAGAGYFAWHELSASPAPAPNGRGRGAQGPAQPVGVATVAHGNIRIIQDALGTVTPLATVTVKTQIAGTLQQIAFTEGQEVQKGDFLTQIDDRPYQALLAQYEGQLAKDQGLLKQAQADLARYQTLVRQDSIARQQADDQAFLVMQDQGAIRSDQAQIDAQKLNITYCHVVAPTAGRVGLRQVDQGNYVQTSDTNGIVVITQLKPMSVVFSIPEDVLPSVQARVAAKASLSVAAFDRANVTRIATGTLSTTDNQIDTTTGTVKLRAIFPNDDEKLFPNQFVNARLLIDTLSNVLVVPKAAVQTGAPGTFVYAVSPDNVVSVVKVTTGPTDGDNVQIVSGLDAGARVVIDGADRLRAGAKVTVQGANPPAADTAAPAGSGPDAGEHEHRRRQAGATSPPATTNAPSTTN
jgi:multidrug efflux system membrane fusion protein